MRRKVVHVRTTDEYPTDWARLIAEIVKRPGWTRQRLADEAKVNRGTIRRWISGESANVSVTSIRLIAEAAGINHEVAARAALGAQRQLKEDDDEAVRMILDSDAGQDVKQKLIAHVRSRRQENEDALRRDVEIWLSTRTATQ